MPRVNSRGLEDDVAALLVGRCIAEGLDRVRRPRRSGRPPLAVLGAGRRRRFSAAVATGLVRMPRAVDTPPDLVQPNPAGSGRRQVTGRDPE
jgi:hypothetical protein